MVSPVVYSHWPVLRFLFNYIRLIAESCDVIIDIIQYQSFKFISVPGPFQQLK